MIKIVKWFTKILSLHLKYMWVNVHYFLTYFQGKEYFYYILYFTPGIMHF